MAVLSAVMMGSLSVGIGKTSECKKQRISEDVFAPSIAEPRLEAYALSPDGTQIAAIVASGDAPEAENTLAIVSVGSLRLKSTVSLGPRSNQAQSPMVAFSSNGKFVISSAAGVRVYDAATLNPLHVLADPDARLTPIALLSQKGFAVVTYVHANNSASYLLPTAACIDVFDVESGELLGHWTSVERPLSLSPDGMSLVLSDDEGGRDGCFGLDIVSTRTGKRSIRIGADSLFATKSKAQKPFCRLVAQFLTAGEIVVTPDGSVDDSGEPLARSLKIVSASDGNVEYELRPEHFGPTGDLHVSDDGSTFATVSRFVPARFLTSHKRLTQQGPPELLVYKGLSLRVRVPLLNLLGLRTYHLHDVAGIRLSFDGSIIGIGQEYSVDLLSHCK